MHHKMLTPHPKMHELCNPLPRRGMGYLPTLRWGGGLEVQEYGFAKMISYEGRALQVLVQFLTPTGYAKELLSLQLQEVDVVHI